jgi:hypothetical protein
LVNLAFPANTLAGDLLLVAFDYKGTTVSSVTDTQGSVFTPLGNQLATPGGALSRVYYAKNIKGGADTVTVKLSAVSSHLGVYLSEYSGINPTNPIDAQVGASGSAGAVSSGNATTTATGDIIYGYCGADVACTAGSGFTARSTLNSNLVEDMPASSAGSYKATGSATGGWTMQMVALKAISSATSSSEETSGAAISLSPTSLTFGSIPVGLSGTSLAVTVTNTGSVSLSIKSLALTGTDPADFSEVTTCGTSLGVGDSCTIVVVFAPLTSGSLSASLTLTDNAASSPQTVSLSGTGGHDVVLTWTASPSAGVSGYYVYRGTASGEESPTPLNSTPDDAVTYTDSNVTAGQKYYYVVTAAGSNGTTQSAKSTEVSATVP